MAIPGVPIEGKQTRIPIKSKKCRTVTVVTVTTDSEVVVKMLNAVSPLSACICDVSTGIIEHGVRNLKLKNGELRWYGYHSNTGAAIKNIRIPTGMGSAPAC